MIIVLSIASLLVISILLFVFIKDGYYEYDLIRILPLSIFSMASLVVLLFIPLSRADSRDLVREYHSIKNTIKSQRVGAESIERAALTNKILEINSDLVQAQHYAQSPYTNWFYDTTTGLLDLQPIQ